MSKQLFCTNRNEIKSLDFQNVFLIVETQMVHELIDLVTNGT